MAEPLQKKLQAELEKYQQLQKELGRAVAARQKLESQLMENNIVQEELSLLDESNAVFKLLGPVLVRQELQEAKGNVGKRLEYIGGEMKRYEQQMQELGAALAAAAGAAGEAPAGAAGQALNTPKKIWGDFGETPPKKKNPPPSQKFPLNSIKPPQNERFWLWVPISQGGSGRS